MLIPVDYFVSEEFDESEMMQTSLYEENFGKNIILISDQSSNVWINVIFEMKKIPFSSLLKVKVLITKSHTISFIF